MTYESARALLKPHGQEHLLRFWDELDAESRASLLADIATLDLDLIGRLHREQVMNPEPFAAGEKLEPLRGEQITEVGRADLEALGLDLLRAGKAAAFLVAGGQGTRLGHDGPKGVFDIGLPSKKSLFQLQAERLIRLGRLSGRPVPWYIMTSRENHGPTTSFFAERDFFGLDRDQVMFFPQAELPLVDADGKILLAEKSRLSLGPNGNGGCFPALKQSGALDDMRRRGVEWVFTYSVDNALVKVCDPVFLGFAERSGLPAASKAVAKAAPDERVGVFCLRDGRPSVIEYSEMTPEMCAARDESGLLYGSANIAVHLFRVDFLEANAAASLPYHAAHKKIPHVGADGAPVAPEAPNAYKFELFMFDLFPRAPGMAVLEVARAEEFAPVKNREGQDSPASARGMIIELHRGWALAAQVHGADMAEAVEVSPLTSYAGEGLTADLFTWGSTRPVLTA
jgi:UDP-N-acetylglucosamine/UDP-N-acetylgalactosamine diphosphorylase